MDVSTGVKYRLSEPSRGAEATSLLVNEFVDVRILPESRIISVVRNATRAETLADIDASWGCVDRVLTPAHRINHNLLVDLREARGRNDADFESRVEGYRNRTVAGFRRVAVLVGTIPGRMQMERYAEHHELHMLRVFSDRDEAVAWLRSTSR